MKKQSRSKRAAPTSKAKPKNKLSATQTSRHFGILQHKHSGHLLPRQHTSYPVLMMIMMCVGVLLFSWTQYVTADVFPGPIQSSYDVHVRVPGPAPTVAATIDSPKNGDVFNDLPITVSGSCPADTYVSLTRNDVYSGTGLCKVDGTYSIVTGLFVGANKLQALVYSQTDVAGPPSTTVNVTYYPAQPGVPPADNKPPVVVGDSSSKPASSSTSSSSPTKNGSVAHPQIVPTVAPLLFKANFIYQGVYTGEPTNWQMDIEGGVPPYAISVDWGDNTTSVVSQTKAGVFSIQHVYRKAGGYKGSYTTTFTASDASGNKTYLQLLAIVNDPPNASLLGKIRSTGQGLGGVSPNILHKLMAYIWPGYGIVSLMLFSFWLGERRELRYLQLHHKKTRYI